MIEDYLKSKDKNEVWNDLKSIYSAEKELIDDIMILGDDILFIMKSGSSMSFSPNNGSFKLLNKEITDKITESLTKDLEHEAIAREKASKRTEKIEGSLKAKPEKKEETKDGTEELQSKVVGDETS